MSGVTVGGWAPHALVRCCATCCATPPTVGHTWMRHFWRGGGSPSVTAAGQHSALITASGHSSSSCSISIGGGDNIANTYLSCHQRVSLCTLHSSSLQQKRPCHQAFRLLHQRFALHGKSTVLSKSTSAMEQHYVNTRLTAPVYPDVVIGNPAQLERKKQAIRAAGLSTLQVIADFDMTLTKYMVNGLRGQSTHALLKSNPVYDLKRQELFEHYYPMEISPSLPADEKAKYMEE